MIKAATYSHIYCFFLLRLYFVVLLLLNYIAHMVVSYVWFRTFSSYVHVRPNLRTAIILNRYSMYVDYTVWLHT